MGQRISDVFPPVVLQNVQNRNIQEGILKGSELHCNGIIQEGGRFYEETGL